MILSKSVYVAFSGRVRVNDGFAGVVKGAVALELTFPTLSDLCSSYVPKGTGESRISSQCKLSTCTGELISP